MMTRFAGSIAVITGGGAGIGRASAVRFAAEGARVAVVDVDGRAADRTVEEIRRNSGEAATYVADVSDDEDMRLTVSAVTERWGTVDVLHNNAASTSAGAPDGDIADIAADMWDHRMAVNLRGVMLGCKYVVPVMRAARRGAIINTSSVSGLIGTDSNAAYGASKAALVSLTRSVATMVGGDGIRCNAVAPGLVATERIAESMSERQLQIYAAERLLPWPASPDDVASTVMWLGSDEARAITGQTIVVDCGTTAQRPRNAIQTWEHQREAR